MRDVNAAGSGGVGAPPNWRVYRYRLEPARSVVLALTCLLISFLVQVALRSALFDVLSIALLLFSTRAWWLPTTFRLSPEGLEITQGGRRVFYRWTRFDGYRIAAGRATVYARRETAEAERVRLVIYLPADMEAEVGEYLQQEAGLVAEPAD